MPPNPGRTQPAAASTDPGHGLQVFSAPSDAPRIRRVNDAVSAMSAVALLVLMALVADSGAGFDQHWAALVIQLPGWILWSAQAVYVAAVAYAALLIVGVAVVARHRIELARDLVLAALLAGGLATLLSRLVDTAWPTLTLVSASHPASTFPAFFVAATTAVQAAAAPHLSAPIRRFGWGLVLGGAAASLLGNATQPSDVVAALLVGTLSAAVVRLTFGTTAGIPSLARVSSGLHDLGVHLADLTYADAQPVSSALIEGTTTDGQPAVVRVLGRDAWDARRWSQLWRFAWYQEADAQQGHSRREQVEHEALALLVAERAGVRVTDLLGVGLSTQEDAIIATASTVDVLDDVDDGEEIDDAELDAIWKQVGLLHTAGISHGALSPISIRIDASGAPVLADFSGSSLRATPQQLGEDLAELLVASALAVGADRAIAQARHSIGDDALAAALPVLEPAALHPALRHQARQQKLKIGALRKQITDDLGVDPPELEKLQRVNPAKVAMALLGGFAVYTIVAQLADVGLSTITDALAKASWPTLVLALLVVACTNAADATSLISISPKPAPLGPATLEQFAINFVNLAVPSSAGRLSVNVRFFQKFGIPGVESTSSSMVASFVHFLGQVVLLTLAVVVGNHSIDLSGLHISDSVIHLVVLVAAFVVLGALLVVAVPKWRHAVGEKLRSPVHQLREAAAVIKQPGKLLRSLGATIASEALYATGLVLCVQALGGSIDLGTAVFINITVSLFAGMSPVPGGIGVAEAGLTAGLVGTGVPNDIAVPAVLLYRMISYYLPPIWGWASMRWLTKHEYL